MGHDVCSNSSRGIQLEDHYEILGVEQSASQSTIREAYRELAKKYHPDRSPSRIAVRLMARINEAYRVLSDPESRADYDRGRKWRDRPADESYRKPEAADVRSDSAYAEPVAQTGVNTDRSNARTPDLRGDGDWTIKLSPRVRSLMMVPLAVAVIYWTLPKSRHGPIGIAARLGTPVTTDRIPGSKAVQNEWCSGSLLACVPGTQERFIDEHGKCTHWCVGPDEQSWQVSYRSDRSMISQGMMLRGERNGPWLWFGRHNQIRAAGSYTRGSTEGSWHFEDEASSASGLMRNHAREGLWTIRWREQQLKCNYSAGRAVDCLIDGERIHLANDFRSEQTQWTVVSATPSAPIALGSACALSMSPVGTEPNHEWIEPVPPFSCKVVVTCGALTLYGKGSSGLNWCDVQNGQAVSVVDPVMSRGDGDPSLRFDMVRGALSIADRSASDHALWEIRLVPADARRTETAQKQLRRSPAFDATQPIVKSPHVSAGNRQSWHGSEPAAAALGPRD